MPSRILYDKGVVEFVKAASTLKKIYKDWRFKLIGTKDYNNPSMVPREIMQKWVKDKVIEIDEYTSDVNKLYEKASIVCLPSHREGFSKVILEAGAASLPIIASDIPGCKEGIINKKTGFLFKLKNHKDLILKFKQLIDDKKLRDKIGKNAYKHVTSNYDVDMINKKIIKLYKKFMNKKKLILLQMNEINFHLFEKKNEKFEIFFKSFKFRKKSNLFRRKI